MSDALTTTALYAIQNNSVIHRKRKAETFAELIWNQKRGTVTYASIWSIFAFLGLLAESKSWYNMNIFFELNPRRVKSMWRHICKSDVINQTWHYNCKCFLGNVILTYCVTFSESIMCILFITCQVWSLCKRYLLTLDLAFIPQALGK